MVLLGAYFLNAACNLAIGLLVAHVLGPAEFGRFALALALGALAQLLAFDWMRLSALRFIRAGAAHDAGAASLDAAFLILALTCGALAAAVWSLGAGTPDAQPLLTLAMAAAIANGLFDYRCAQMRAQFRDWAYARLMIAKNVCALALTVGTAVVTGSAHATIAAACVAMAAPVVASGRGAAGLRALRGVDVPWLRRCLRYSGPIVLAGALYAAIPVLNRYALAQGPGYAEAGFFALAHDVGSRLLAAVGAALDVLLFQIAVREDNERGRAAARAQIARNLTLIVATLAAAALGCWLTLPSLEAVIAPPEYRGPFAASLAALLPGLFCQAAALFALSAMYQIERRTGPLIAAAAIGLGANVVVLLVGARPDLAFIGGVQSGAFAAAALTLVLLAPMVGAKAPPLRDLAASLGALAAMVLVVYPLRWLEPGAITLALQTSAGALVFLGVLAACDVAGLRRWLREGRVARPDDSSS